MYIFNGIKIYEYLLCNWLLIFLRKFSFEYYILCKNIKTIQDTHTKSIFNAYIDVSTGHLKRNWSTGTCRTSPQVNPDRSAMRISWLIPRTFNNYNYYNQLSHQNCIIDVKMSIYYYVDKSCFLKIKIKETHIRT